MDNVAVIIGATGAVGREILEEVLEKDVYKKVYVLGRSSVTNLANNEKLEKIVVDFENFDEEIIKEEGNSNKNFDNYSSIEDVWLHFSKACDFYEYILDEIRCEIKYANCPITDYCI